MDWGRKRVLANVLGPSTFLFTCGCFLCVFWGHPRWLSGKESPPPRQEMQETQVPSLGREDSPLREMATRSSILAWRIPRTEEPVGLQSPGSQETRLSSERSTRVCFCCYCERDMPWKAVGPRGQDTHGTDLGPTCSLQLERPSQPGQDH